MKLFHVDQTMSGSPGIYIDGKVVDHLFAATFTWLGAYWGCFWRNLLGKCYIPISPVRRRDLYWARKSM